MSYQAAWKSLRWRKVLYQIARFVPVGLFALYQYLRARPPSSFSTSLLGLGPWNWFFASVAIVVGFLFWMMAFRCPRCKKRFMEVSGLNKNCSNCGLPLNAEA